MAASATRSNCSPSSERTWARAVSSPSASAQRRTRTSCAARFGRGTFTYIGSATEVQEKMTALFEKLESPVLTNVELHLDDPHAEMWPKRIPDLYVGEPVVVAVRFSSPTGRVTASGKLGDHQWNGTAGNLPAGTPATGRLVGGEPARKFPGRQPARP